MKRHTLPLVLGLAAVLAASCLRPMEERAERDLTIGQAERGGVKVEVVDGLAAVRDIDRNRLKLWASAPALQIRVSTPPGDPISWRLGVENLLPDTVLEVKSSVAVIDVQELESAFATTKRYRAELAGGEEITLSLGPPDVDSEDPFTIAVLSDVQDAIDRVGDFYDSMNLDPSLRFVLGAGDLTEQGTAEQLDRFQQELGALRIPYYATLGNHELGVSPPPWHDYFGRASFHFVYRNVAFSMLDSASASIDPLVYEWLDSWLERQIDRVHIAAMHIPPIDPAGVRNGSFGSRNEAAKLLGRLADGRVDLTIYGHIHSYYRFENAGIEAHISGGGGAIPERFDGVGRHYLKLTIDPEEGILGTRVIQIDD